MQPLQQPPWRTIAEEMLKTLDRERYKELRRKGRLDAFLNGLTSQAEGSYRRMIEDMQEANPTQPMSWMMQAAEEMVLEHVVRPNVTPL